jgi:hypothetical protein
MRKNRKIKTEANNGGERKGRREKDTRERGKGSKSVYKLKYRKSSLDHDALRQHSAVIIFRIYLFIRSI